MIDYALTPQQLTVIGSLSSGASMTEAAEEAGIHRNTINNWRRNQLPFQHALVEAQYDRALYYREQAEALVDEAFAAVNQILADPKTPAGVRLKAALALIQLATTPPPPKKQIELVFQSQPSQNLHNPAQPAPVAPKTPEPRPITPNQAIMHNSAQAPIRRESPKVGRNEPCPCGSGLKHKRCCLEKPLAAAA
jgi:transposase-like protein